MILPPASPRPPAARLVFARRAVAVTLLLSAGAGPAAAQTPECDRLRTAIQSGGDSGGGRWARAAAQQQSEIDRTQSYANRLGCGGGFFGLGEPAPCGELHDRLDRMRDNLATLRERAGGGGAETRAALMARYSESCGDLRGGSGFDDGASDPRQDFFDEGTLTPQPSENGTEPDGGRRLGQAICVRTCDGGWFPFGFSANEGQLDGLQQLCQAECPNTEARLYTMPRDGALGDAVAADGTAYTALPAAFKFEKSFAPTCTCKPPNQSWTEALAKAEAMIGDPDQHDVVVTAALSDQMAKPGAVPVGRDPSKSKTKGKTPPVPAGDADLAAAATREAQKAAQAPTASHAASGIGGPAKTERIVRQDEGQRVSVPGPGGTTRTLRLIVP